MPGPRSIKTEVVGSHKRRTGRKPTPVRQLTPEVRATWHSTLPTHLPWDVRLIPTERLKPAARRTRRHTKKKIAQLGSIIKELGFVEPIIADEELRILSGHARAEAAAMAGHSQVPVIVLTGLTDAQKRVLALALNRFAENAAWDRPVLALELKELSVILPELNLDLELTGFEAADIDNILVDLADQEGDPADEIVTPELLAVSQLGDVWRCGINRLICGDATDKASYVRLLGEQQARMVIADPPYNVKIRNIVGRGKTKHREFKEGSGEKSRAEFQQFLQKFMTPAASFSAPGSIHFIFMDWRHIIEVVTAGEAVYGELKNLVVWNKNNAGQGSLYRSQHELVTVFKSGDGQHVNNIELGKHGRNRSNVWTYAGVNTFRTGRMDDLSVHPTVKPVALVADAMRDCSRRGDIVLDPFLGSGTTLLAAEKIGRRAYGIELDPLYVDVALRRWQSFTKRDAILERTGETFEEVAARAAKSRRSTR